MLDRLFEDAVPPQVAVGVRCDRRGAQAGQGPVDLATALGVVAFADQLEVDGEIAALGPTGRLGQHRPAAGQDKDQVRRVIIDEQRGDQPGRGGQFVAVLVETKRLGQRRAVLCDDVFDFTDRLRQHDGQRRAIENAGCRDTQHRSVLVDRQTMLAKFEHADDPLVDRRYGVGQGSAVGGTDSDLRLGQFGQLGQVGFEFLALLGEAAARRRALLRGLCVPLLAAGEHPRVERLLGRVGREVMLGDPALADQDRVGNTHACTPVSGVTTSSGRTS